MGVEPHQAAGPVYVEGMPLDIWNFDWFLSEQRVHYGSIWVSIVAVIKTLKNKKNTTG